MLHVTLYKYTNKPIIVDKSSYLGTGTTIQSNSQTSNQDMEKPTVLLKFSTEPDYNYLYIQEYHRYYFVTNKTWVSGDIWSFSCQVDERYTYKALIQSLSGIVAYSNSGSPLKYDPRLIYNKAPQLSRAITDSTIKAPDQFYIVMPTIFFNSGAGVAPKNNMKYFIFPLATFDRFMGQYTYLMGSDKEEIIEVGKLIQQIVLVTWLDPNDFLHYEYNNTGKITFDSPAINEIIGGGHAGGYEITFDSTVDPLPYYVAYDDTMHRGLNLSWRISNDYYWQRKALRTLYIPFVGKVNLSLDDMGIGMFSGGYIGVNIRYDYSSNSYILTPGYAAVATGANNFDTVLETRSLRVPNQYTSPFAVDTSFQFNDAITTRQSLTTMNQYIGDSINNGLALGGGTTQLASNLINNLIGMGIQNATLAYQTAASLAVQGTNNGGSPDSVYIYDEVDGGGNIVKMYPSAFMETIQLNPSNDFADFWADHGYPDGDHRSLTSMTGYVKMQEFEMKYSANATIGEMERLEQYLYQGVIL